MSYFENFVFQSELEFEFWLYILRYIIFELGENLKLSRVRL